MRLMKALSGLAIFLFLATACIKVDGEVVVNEDGSGSVDFISAIDPEAFNEVVAEFGDAAAAGTPDDLCEGFTTDLGQDATDFPPDARFSDYDEDGFCGARVQYALPASDDHSELVQPAFDETTRLYKQGDNWVFETDFDISQIEEGSEGAPPFVVDALFAESSFVIAVQLPGQPVAGENNATTVEGGRFTWELDLANPPARLFAQTEPAPEGSEAGGDDDGGGLDWGMIAFAIALAVALLAFTWYLLDRRKNAAKQEPAASADPGWPTAVTDSVLNQGPGTEATAEPTPAATQQATEAQPQAQPAQEAAPASPEPVYDEALGAWTIDDPTHGRLMHDPSTGKWRRI